MNDYQAYRRLLLSGGNEPACYRILIFGWQNTDSTGFLNDYDIAKWLTSLVQVGPRWYTELNNRAQIFEGQLKQSSQSALWPEHDLCY
jgi:hypothetical protein